MDVQTLLDYQFQGSHLPMSLAIRIHEESQGSPEYIHDIIAGLKENEIIVEAGGLWKLNADQFELPVPPSSREYFGPLVKKIPEADLGVLQLASVIGKEFDIEEIARFLTVNKVELFQRLRRAVSRTDLLWIEGRRIGFVHAQARKLIHETIPRDTRQVYHQQYAEYLFDSHRDRLAGISDVLSYHYLESGNRKKAISLFVNLGEQAAEEENYATARRYFEEALAQFSTDKVPREMAEKQSWIFFKLGEVDYGEGSFDSALSRFRKAVDLANRLKDVRLLSRAQEAVWRCEEKLGIRKS
jgi:predicted ATPase